MSGSITMGAGTITSKQGVNDFYAGVNTGGIQTGNIQSNGANGLQINYGGLLYFVPGQPANNAAGMTIRSGSLTVTGSIKTQNIPITVASSTASVDVLRGNMFNINLVSGYTFVNITNTYGAQSIDLLLSTPLTGSLLTFSSNVKQIAGQVYTPTTGSSTSVDILTLKNFGNSTSGIWYVSSIAKDISV